MNQLIQYGKAVTLRAAIVLGTAAAYTTISAPPNPIPNRLEQSIPVQSATLRTEAYSGSIQQTHREAYGHALSFFNTGIQYEQTGNAEYATRNFEISKGILEAMARTCPDPSSCYKAEIQSVQSHITKITNESNHEQ